MIDIEVERPKFELALDSVGSTGSLVRKPDGRYFDPEIALAFRVWIAAKRDSEKEKGL